MEELKKKIEAILEDFWDNRVLPEADDEDSIGSLVDPMESITAVDVIVPIEDLVGFEIDQGQVIRRGGYESREQFVGELTEQILKVVAEQKS